MSYDEFLEAPSDGALGLVSSLAAQQREAEARVSDLRARLKTAQEHLRQIAEDRLPAAMADCRVKKFTTDGGLTVRVDEKFRASQLDDKMSDEEKRRPLTERIRALEYLEDQGDGGLMRRVVQVTLERDMGDAAQELVALLRTHRLGNQLRIEEFRTVHPMTLSSHVRSRLREGGELDLELLGVSRVTVAKVTSVEKHSVDDEPF